jgi:hypothetical protein
VTMSGTRSPHRARERAALERSDGLGEGRECSGSGVRE